MLARPRPWQARRRAPRETDALVLGAGPSGLAAANILADAGWEVLVLKASPEPGGTVRTAEAALPAFRHDHFSALYPLAAVSPVLQGLGLEDFGLRWPSPLPLVQTPTRRRCAMIAPTRAKTEESSKRLPRETVPGGAS
jgi:phytoene dehydrogenase-like protein